QEYHNLSIGRTSEDCFKCIVFGNLTSEELNLKCQLFATAQKYCVNRTCTRRPSMCLALNLPPRDVDPTQTFHVITNYPVCDNMACVKWIAMRQDQLLTSLTKDAKQMT